MTRQLAQINVGRLRYELDDPRLGDFVNNLARINGLAEQSDGFVWRLMDEIGNATSIRVYDDPRIIVNMSVWQSIEALQLFAYRTEHAQFFRRRMEWFEEFGGPSVALWWVDGEKRPTAMDGKAKLEHLGVHGPSPLAFTFRERFAEEVQTPA